MVVHTKTIQFDEKVGVPEVVLKFSRANGIETFVEKAIQTTREMFADADQISVGMKEDEYGESYVSINAAIRDNPESEAEKYSACVQKWSSFLPAAVGSKIQLSTSWAS
jgi:hypothetical protein